MQRDTDKAIYYLKSQVLLNEGLISYSNFLRMSEVLSKYTALQQYLFQLLAIISNIYILLIIRWCMSYKCGNKSLKRKIINQFSFARVSALLKVWIKSKVVALYIEKRDLYQKKVWNCWEIRCRISELVFKKRTFYVTFIKIFQWDVNYIKLTCYSNFNQADYFALKIAV